jgi:hypothetical protein
MHLLEISTTRDLHDHLLERKPLQHHAALQTDLESQHHLARALTEMVMLRTMPNLLQDPGVIATMDMTAHLPVVHLEAGIKQTSNLHQVVQRCPCLRIIDLPHPPQCSLRRHVHVALHPHVLMLLPVLNVTSPLHLHHEGVVVCHFEADHLAQLAGKTQAWKIHPPVPVVAVTSGVARAVVNTV